MHIFAFLFLAVVATAATQASEPSKAAVVPISSPTAVESVDAAWQALFPPDGEPSNESVAEARLGAGTTAFRAWGERYRLRWYDHGFKFWEMYPEDARKWDWLRLVMLDPPFFWADAAQGAEAYARGAPQSARVDQAAIDEWLRRRVALRAALLYEAPESLRMTIWELRYRELQGSIEALGVNSDASRWSEVSNQVMDYCAGAPSEYRDLARSLAMPLFHHLADRGPQDLGLSFTTALKSLPHGGYVELASGFEQLAKLRDRPFEEKLTTMSGGTFDPKALRGKVWLLDGWNTHCSACMDFMRAARPIYDRYKTEGFEVIGVCFESESDRARIDKMLALTGANWPQSIQGKLGKSAFATRYGIVFNPVTWLFDQEGRLVTVDVNSNQLEQKVRSLLGLPPINLLNTTSAGNPKS